MVVRLFVSTILALSFAVAGCSESATEVTHKSEALASPFDTGVLNVATRNGSTTYYLDRHENPVGPEFTLVSEYAQARGWQVEWTMLESTSAVLDALEAGTTHLAAAGLTHLPERNGWYTRGPAHTEITEQLVTASGYRIPRRS